MKNIKEIFGGKRVMMPAQGLAERVAEGVDSGLIKLPPTEIVKHQQWINGQLEKTGITGGLVEAVQIRSSYYADIVSQILEVTSAGGNVSILLGDISQSIADVFKENDVRQRAIKCLELTGSIATGKGKKHLVALSRQVPAAFDPWRNVFALVEQNKRGIVRNIDLLGGAVRKSDSALVDVGKRVQSSGNSINKVAREYDAGLATQERIDTITRKSSELSTRLVEAVMAGNTNVSQIASELALQKGELASLANSMLARNRAASNLLEQNTKIAGEMLGVRTIGQANRAIRINEQANIAVAQAVPLLALSGLATSVEIVSLWSMWASYKMSEMLLGDPNIGLSPEMMRNMIAQSTQSQKEGVQRVIESGFPQN